MLLFVRRMLRPLVPLRIRKARAASAVLKQRKRFAHLSSQEIFDTVYKARYWGRENDESGLSSGSGSRDPDIVEPYVEAVNLFLRRFLPNPLHVVDIGCGDFFVGRRLVPNAATYSACDVSRHVIDELQRDGHHGNVKFFHLDAANDELPKGNVVIIRQVMQHLSNEEISKIIQKLYSFDYLILAEHLPIGPFVPNLDKPTGPDIRLSQKSGVVITEEPFRFTPAAEAVICETKNKSADGGMIRTILYRIKSEE
ncbi:class I SAM-dependent methyltransferase [Mesorhizobium sp. M1163]|uniref:class I SAM-dependent methyltransferase n=1 Tax=Mesorhizobium sp. M1163 TaxID=2957065 RepID=UPI003338E624